MTEMMRVPGKNRQTAKNLKKNMNRVKRKVKLLLKKRGESNEISKGESYNI